MRNDCPVRCLRTAFRTCRENPILSAANEKSGRKRLIYAICCDRIVIPIYGAFSSRRTADIPGVHRIGGARGRHGATGRIFALLAPPGTGFSRISPKPKLSKSGFVRSRLSPEAEAPAHRKTAVYHFHCRRGDKKYRKISAEVCSRKVKLRGNAR